MSPTRITITRERDLSPSAEKAVSYCLARVFMAIGVAVGALWGAPVAYVGAAVLAIYAFAALAWTAWKEVP